MIFQPTDLISVELEIEFGGDRPEDPPKSAVDNKFKKDKATMGFETLFASTGDFIIFRGRFS